MRENVRARLRAITEQYLSTGSGCHRLDHTQRVVANALRLAVHYPKVDLDVLEAAAWLHDIGRGMERAEGISHAKISAEYATNLLPKLRFSPGQTEVAVAAIADHRFSAKRVPASMEGKILQDADRLDALGAIGIARTFAESMERPLYHSEDPFAEHRSPDDTRYAVDHFYCKLFQLPATLHTPEARALADGRVAYMREFLDELRREL